MEIKSKFGFEKVKIRDTNVVGRIKEIIVLENGAILYSVENWLMGIELRHFTCSERELIRMEENDNGMD